VPSGTGILHVGVDDSLIANNRIENNDFTGIAMVDYCLVVLGTPFDCGLDPSVTPEFFADQTSSGNRVIGNVLVNNGTSPDPGDPFAFTAADLTFLSFGEGNCFADNVFSTLFSLTSELPACE
jgi:hypothetical protein